MKKRLRKKLRKAEFTYYTCDLITGKRRWLTREEVASVNSAQRRVDKTLVNPNPTEY
jgi:hypothetical protein